LINCGRGLSWDYSCKVWSKSNEQFQGRRCLNKIVDARIEAQTMDDGQWALTKAHLEDISSGELIKKREM